MDQDKKTYGLTSDSAFVRPDQEMTTISKAAYSSFVRRLATMGRMVTDLQVVNAHQADELTTLNRVIARRKKTMRSQHTRLEAIKNLHRKADGDDTLCEECLHDWPCATYLLAYPKRDASDT